MILESTSIMSKFKIWWLTIRPATLWAGSAPVFLGTALAFEQDKAKLGIALLALICAIFIQIACNLVNDYSDFQKGTDNDQRLGPARAAHQGWLTVDQLKKAVIYCLAIALILGLYLSYVGGIYILLLGIASLLAAVAYTAGPFPLAYLGLGDLFVLLFFGLGAVCGTYYLQTQELNLLVILASLAVGSIATAILVVNNLRDRINDAKSHKNTLAVRFGAGFTRFEYFFLLVFAFLFCLYAFFSVDGKQAYSYLVPMIFAPYAYRLGREVQQKDGKDLNPLLGKTAKLELFYCLSLSLGIVFFKQWS